MAGRAEIEYADWSRPVWLVRRTLSFMRASTMVEDSRNQSNTIRFVR